MPIKLSALIELIAVIARRMAPLKLKPLWIVNFSYRCWSRGSKKMLHSQLIQNLHAQQNRTLHAICDFKHHQLRTSIFFLSYYYSLQCYRC